MGFNPDFTTAADFAINDKPSLLKLLASLTICVHSINSLPFNHSNNDGKYDNDGDNILEEAYRSFPSLLYQTSIVLMMVMVIQKSCMNLVTLNYGTDTPTPVTPSMNVSPPSFPTNDINKGLEMRKSDAEE